MTAAPLPVNEALRLQELHALKILDTERDQDYDEIVELAAQICDCPTALITFIDEDRQWFKAKKNMTLPETDRDISFCSHTILQKDTFTVTDAKNDERFAKNPLVTGDLNIGFYAGAPILSSNGLAVGSVCVIDTQAREKLSIEQSHALQTLARQVSKLVELRLKNRQIQAFTEAQVTAEKKMSQILINESDGKENLIANELHENLAQSLAGIKMLLDTASYSPEMQPEYVKTAKEAIGELIDEVKQVSKTIAPTTLLDADYYDTILESVNNFSNRHNISISLSPAIEIKIPDSALGINFVKIVLQQLELSKSRNAREIEIEIYKDEMLNCIIHDDTLETHLEGRNLNLLNNIMIRVERASGTVVHKISAQGYTLHFKIPIAISL